MRKQTIYDEAPLSDLIRQRFADRKISVPDTIWDRRFIAVAINDVLAIIVDRKKNEIVSLLDADSVDIANALPCNVTVDKNNGYRIYVSGSSWGIGSTIGLSVAILCYHDGFFSGYEFEVHHDQNPCDNRREYLQKRNSPDKHPPKIQDSQKHIRQVLAEYGFTYQEALCIANEKIKNRNLY